jgi:hypothetical protein
MKKGFQIKAGCNNRIITATLQGQRVIRTPLKNLSKAQINELGERFNYKYVEPEGMVKTIETANNEQPKKRKKPTPPSGTDTEADV